MGSVSSGQGSRRRSWQHGGKSLVVGVGLMVALSAMAFAPATPGEQRAGVAWQTVWYENFAGPAGQGLGSDTWKYDTGQGIFGNGQVETMTNSTRNVYLDGHGNLDITALKDGGKWTSGRVQTVQEFGAQPGGEVKFLASIKQPDPASGLGYWPAFWLLGPGTWPQDGEMDIMEDINALSGHSAALHCGNLTQQNSDGTFGPCHEDTGISSGLQPCSGCQTGYHTYALTINRRNKANEQIYWYLDGKQFFTVSESQVGTEVWQKAVDHNFSIILDLAMGGAYPNSRCNCTTPTSQTTSGGTMSVQYIRVSVR